LATEAKTGFERLIVIAEEVKGGGRRSSRKLRDHEAKEGLATEDKVKKTEGSGGSEARGEEARSRSAVLLRSRKGRRKSD